MSALEAAQRYFDAWNARDAKAILASLTEAGTYADPLTGGAISGDAIVSYVETLWGAFPDLTFEIRSAAETGNGRVAAEWIMRGTNRGPFRGLPPTGKAVETVGADFIETEGGRVSSVVGYFDGGSVPTQLGLQIVVQPREIAPFTFGVSTAVHSGRKDVPGAFSVTQLQAIDEAAVQKVRELSRTILTEMLAEPGFIGATTATIGRRMVTINAWTDPDAPSAFMRKATHGQSMKAFFGGALAESAYTSAWSRARVNPYWVRCPSCGKMQDRDKIGPSCTCGAALPEHPPYW
jgi:steroid delta-isomerase-like uncharacterized protein